MRYLIGCLICLMMAGCVDLPRNFKPAGFDSSDEVLPYVHITSYLTANLEDIDWKIFYKRFPEYWEDIQLAKYLGGTIDHHPWYTAYAFRWTTLNRKKPTWSAEKIRRLERHQFVPGDTPFEIFYGLGPPERLMWDNDFEILLYETDVALIMESGRLKKNKICTNCWEFILDHDDETPVEDQMKLHDNQILATLGLSRPDY